MHTIERCRISEKHKNHFYIKEDAPVVWWYIRTLYRIEYNKTLKKLCVKVGNDYIDEPSLILILKELRRVKNAKG